MTTSGVLYAVFLLPVIFSITFGTLVMTDILQKPGRELNMWRFAESESHGHTQSIEIIGLQKQYFTSQPISFNVMVTDPDFDCGDLYIKIHSDDKQVVAHSSFFNQCFDHDDSILTAGYGFSEPVSVPGIYKAVIMLTDTNQENSLTTSEMFTVRRE